VQAIEADQLGDLIVEANATSITVLRAPPYTRIALAALIANAALFEVWNDMLWVGGQVAYRVLDIDHIQMALVCQLVADRRPLLART
jgi:hypothetical protein